MAAVKRRIAGIAGALFRDGLGLAGIGLLVYGAARIYEPAGYIIGGGFGLGISVLYSIRAGRAG